MSVTLASVTRCDGAWYIVGPQYMYLLNSQMTQILVGFLFVPLLV